MVEVDGWLARLGNPLRTVVTKELRTAAVFSGRIQSVETQRHPTHEHINCY